MREFGKEIPFCMDFETKLAKKEEQQGVSYIEDKVYIRLCYEQAVTLSLEMINGGLLEFIQEKQKSYWSLELPENIAFSYVKVIMNGEWVISPYLPITFGDNKPMNFLDISKEKTEENIQIPCGTIHIESYQPKESKDKKNCYVYTPFGYEENKEEYPVLYLLHGYGENELGWLRQGKVHLLADKLNYDRKCIPMILVMANGMNYFEMPNGDWSHNPKQFVKELLLDIIPMIETKYRIKKEENYRAIAGLSMGGMQTAMAAAEEINKFAWVGLFSGFMSNIFDNDNEHIEKLKNNAHEWNEKVHLFFRAMGDEDPYLELFQKEDILCLKHKIKCERKIYQGAHDWNVWRQCIEDFMKHLFQL